MFQKLKGVGEVASLKITELLRAYVTLRSAKHMRKISSGLIEKEGEL
jgi:hypothetical protein